MSKEFNNYINTQNSNNFEFNRELGYEIDKNIYVSLMGQYFPTPAVMDHPMLSRRLTSEEYEQATDMFFGAGLINGFSQDLDSATEEYVPNFDLNILKKILNK